MDQTEEEEKTENDANYQLQVTEIDSPLAEYILRHPHLKIKHSSEHSLNAFDRAVPRDKGERGPNAQAITIFNQVATRSSPLVSPRGRVHSLQRRSNSKISPKTGFPANYQSATTLPTFHAATQ